jgi:hypothetical protein
MADPTFAERVARLAVIRFIRDAQAAGIDFPPAGAHDVTNAGNICRIARETHADCTPDPECAEQSAERGCWCFRCPMVAA